MTTFDYLEEALEPRSDEANRMYHDHYIASIAISLKRIADTLEFFRTIYRVPSCSGERHEGTSEAQNKPKT